jgi:hypothetical protein
MAFNPDDVTILCLYRQILLPWEKELKIREKQWNPEPLQIFCENSGLLIERTEQKAVAPRASELEGEATSEFFVITRGKSLPYDLARHIRNAFAHGGVSASNQNSSPSLLRFVAPPARGTGYAFVGQLFAKRLQSLIQAILASAPKS